MITVTSPFAGTVQALAEANGPYIVDAAVQLLFTGDPDRPNTTYEWDFGDGATAVGRSVGHAYADNGIYCAKLTTTVNEPGGVVTREFAQVRVRNVPPVVDTGPPLSVDEGTELEVVATFTDVEWPDTHRARFHWGDNTQPTEGVVAETNDPPRSQGTATAKHTWCDSGTFTVTVEVEDDDGGIGSDTVEVEVRNVPPTVDAGVDLFAYRCTPLNLVAWFTDPGWCDTHTGTWDFGDCTPVQPAIVREKHEPPAGTGIVVATHRYDTCGNFYAVCVVTDDDGGRGEDQLIVRVVDVRNPGMEGGFRSLVQGVVANEWEPYAGTPPQPNPFAVGGLEGAVQPAKIAAARYSAQEFVVHAGQRSQCIGADGAFGAGLWQRVGANVGWDYQITCWYHVDEQAPGVARLGVDAAGGSNAAAPTVSWSEGTTQHEWQQLAVRVTATQRMVTIFLEAQAVDATRVFFDDVELTPFPCAVPEPKPPEQPERPFEKCIEWRDEREPRKLGERYEKDGFVFVAGAGELQIVTWGSPPGVGKLYLSKSGLDVALPWPAQRVVATVAVHTRDPVTMTAISEDGSVVDSATTSGAIGVMERLVVDGARIVRVRFSGGGNEALLIRLCAYSRERPESEPEVHGEGACDGG